MSKGQGYHVEPFGPNRRMVAAAAAVNAEKHTIHLITEADVQRTVCIDGVLQDREVLCLTVSFNHDIVDGAPAARFTSSFTQHLASGEELRDCASHTAVQSEFKAAAQTESEER